MKQINKGYGLIAVICLFTTRVGALENVSYVSDTSLTSEEQVYTGRDVGLFFGDPAGPGTNNWLSEAAMDASTASAWSFVGINSFKFHADCVWHNYDLIKTRQLLESLSVYYGVGGRMKLNGSKERNDKDDDARFGMRSPLGVSYVFPKNPVELFAEVVPIVDIVPETRLGVGVGIGARYYFSLL